MSGSGATRAPYGSELTRLIPALSSRMTDVPQPKATDSDTERYLLFTAVVGLLAEVSADEPVMLIFDDLQWADSGSLLLLRHLATTELPMRVLILATLRDHELPNAKELRDTVGELWRQRRVSRLELEGLNHGDVVSYMEAAAGHKLDENAVALAHAVHRETDGNPFFLSEVLRYLAETGGIYQDVAGQWMQAESLGPLALPDSVREVVGGRVARLGDRAERSLSVAAVIGRRFDFDLLTRSTRFPEDEVLEILEAATAAALVREVAGPPGHYTFAHALDSAHDLREPRPDPTFPRPQTSGRGARRHLRWPSWTTGGRVGPAVAERVGWLRFGPGDPLCAPGGGRRPQRPGSG